MINLNEFLGTTIDKASEKLQLIPPSDSGYVAQIMPDGIDLKDFKYKTGERAGQTGYRMTVKWEIQDEELKAQLKRTPVITQSIMLNFTDEGALAAENPGLRALREAVNQNQDGKPWQPAMLIGQMARLYVSHRIDDKGEEQQDVQKVVKL
jgi:hypothetical protein